MAPVGPAHAATRSAFLAFAFFACTPPVAQSDAAKPLTSTKALTPEAPPAAPAAQSGPAQRGACPLAIVPGRALGPIRLGVSLASLAATGLPLTNVSRHGTTEFVDAGPFRVRACGGTIVETWIDDLRSAPDCVKVDEKPVARSIARPSFEAMFRNCHDTPIRIGGAFTECEGGGVRIGYGMGDFIQVRVGRAGADIDEECADVLDDGGAITLSAAELTALVQRVLDVDRLAPYWRPDKPNRDPLRLVRSPFLAIIAGSDAKPLTLFGSKVEWVDRDVASKDKKPYFEFTRFEATARRVLFQFRYPVEGVTGSVTFQKRHDEWVLQDKSVAER